MERTCTFISAAAANDSVLCGSQVSESLIGLLSTRPYEPWAWAHFGHQLSELSSKSTFLGFSFLPCTEVRQLTFQNQTKEQGCRMMRVLVEILAMEGVCLLVSICFKHTPCLEDLLSLHPSNCHPYKPEKKSSTDVLGTIFIVPRTVYFPQLSQ